MPDYLLCEFGNAHGIPSNWHEGATFMQHIFMHVFSSGLLDGEEHSCSKLPLFQ